MSTPAIFLDRDGTLIPDAGYLSDPAGVELLAGVPMALRRLKQAGYLLVIVTNQSGVARGMFDEAAVDAVHAELTRQLAEHSLEVDAIYYCPCHPEGHVHPYACESEHRKPRPGMLLQAAEEMDIDLAGSWMIGDKPADIAAGKRAGCRTVRIEPQADVVIHAEADLGDVTPDFVEASLLDAVAHIVTDPPEVDRPHFTLEQPTPAPAGDDANEVRREILRNVRQLTRRSGQGEFNLAHVAGGIAQMFSLLLIVVVFYRLLSDQPTDITIVWGILAMIFQTMSLTFFSMNKSS